MARVATRSSSIGRNELRIRHSTAEDSVIADRKQDHQEPHQEMKDSGRTFHGMNKLYQQETGNQIDDGSGPPNDESVTIVALTEDGELKASGKTGLNEKDLARAALSTRFQHGHTVNPVETAAQNQRTGTADSSELLAANIARNVPNLDQIRRFDDIQTDAGSHQAIAPLDVVQVSQNLSDSTDVLDKVTIAEKPREKLIPKDGDDLTLKQILNDYKTPFIDVYERSKQLKRGESGKSKTLEDVVDRLKTIPWAHPPAPFPIHIKFNSKAANPEYDNKTSTISIRPQDSHAKQIENFAHEGFHATHQFLSKLYDHGVSTKDAFVNIWLDGEVESMLTEVRVYRELELKGCSPQFHFIRDGREDHLDIQEYVNQHGKAGLREFLRTAQPTGQGAKPYGQHYADFYDSYKQNFKQNKPAVEKYIRQWLQSGHRREDI